jgi:hypothetical protein
MNLFAANRQWSQRPADERFSNLQEMHAACFGYYERAVESVTPLKSLMTVADGEEVKLVNRETGNDAQFTHWAFGQMAKRIGAPASYLRELPPTIAATCINHGINDLKANPNVEMMFHKNGHLVLRALTSEKYARIWNWEVTERLFALEADGWRVPPARPAFDGQPGSRQATELDVLNASDFGLSVSVGDLIAPAGLYASDHDMFAFYVNENARINDGTEHGLARGVFIENGEVGEVAFKITRFLYRHVCGNHIVWDASSVSQLKVRHVGTAPDKAFSKLKIDLEEYANESVSDEEARIQAARSKVIAAKKEDVLDAIFKLRVPELSQKQIAGAYDIAEQHRDTDGAPNTVWSMVQGITRLSQATPHVDTRTKLDRAAGKVLRIAF